MDGGFGGDASGCDDDDGDGEQGGGAGLRVGGITTRDGGRLVGFLYVWKEQVDKMLGEGHGRRNEHVLT